VRAHQEGGDVVIIGVSQANQL